MENKEYEGNFKNGKIEGKGILYYEINIKEILKMENLKEKE